MDLENQKNNVENPKDEVDGEGFTPLGRAVRDGNQEWSKELVRAGADPAQGYPGSTPFAEAVAKGQEQAAHLMLEKLVQSQGSNSTSKALDGLDLDGLTPLIAALNAGLDALAASIVRAGANMHSAYQQHQALPLAITSGQNQAALAMIKISKEYPSRGCLNDTDAQSRSALMCAIRSGREDLGLALIKAGAKMHKEMQGEAVLPLAIKSGQISVALAMIERSKQFPSQSCLNDSDAHGDEALLCAIKEGDEETAVALVQAGAKLRCHSDEYAALPMAIKMGQRKTALSMIERSKQYPTQSCLNTSDEDGDEALLCAIKKGDEELAVALVQAGADLRCHSGGSSALPMAINMGRRQTARAMIERSKQFPSKSCLEASDAGGDEALICAIKKGDEDTAVALVQAGAELRCHSGEYSALPMAIQMGRRKTALAMIERSKRLSSQSCLEESDENNDKALICAIKKGDEDIALALVQAGAELRCHSGRTSALPMAIKMGRRQTALAMIEWSKGSHSRSCLEESDENNDKALICAIEKGDEDMAVALVQAGAELSSSSYGGWGVLPLCVSKMEDNPHFEKLALEIISRAWAVHHSSFLNAKSPSGETAIFIALRLGCQRIATELALKGDTLDAHNGDETTVLGAAIAAGAADAALVIIKRGSKGNQALDKVGPGGPEAILAASKAGMHQVVLALISISNVKLGKVLSDGSTVGAHGDQARQASADRDAKLQMANKAAKFLNPEFESELRKRANDRAREQQNQIGVLFQQVLTENDDQAILVALTNFGKLTKAARKALNSGAQTTPKLKA